MALDYATEVMFRGCETLALSGGDLRARLQRAWTDDVQLIWHRQCLTVDLAQRFRALWESYTEKTKDPRTTTLRVLSDEEARAAATALLAFSRDVTIAHGGGAVPGEYWKISGQ
ncbi:MAG: hypothetical protein KBA31_06455 [Alphaproteobacteria bacterium]|nr:hypothetical protein [Alphaproteobacteria bacterium]